MIGSFAFTFFFRPNCDSWTPLQNALLLNLFYFRREFARAKTCLKDAVTEHCTFDADAMEILQSAFDSYNPFCNVLTEDKGKLSAWKLIQVTILH